MTKHDLTPIQYLYRDHLILRFVDHNDRFAWRVTDVPNGPDLCTGDDIDECMAAVDEVLDDFREEAESAANAVPNGEKR